MVDIYTKLRKSVHNQSAAGNLLFIVPTKST